MVLNLRYIAQFVIEALTPLNIGSGEHDALVDALVATDANGLPVIPGTSLCGVLKHALIATGELSEEEINDVFGYALPNSDDGRGSRLIVSNANFIGPDGVVEGLRIIEWVNPFYAKFAKLPVREHCKISHTGATDSKSHGKFDNQVVYKGTRFKFELELIGCEEDAASWARILNILKDDTFRIGGGTRKGYGAIKIISLAKRVYDLNLDRADYLAKSARLSENLQSELSNEGITNQKSEKWNHYSLVLKPDDFYIFGSGFGDNEVDMIPVFEEVIEWEGNKPHFTNKQILITGSAVKGAIAHRVAFHFNKIMGRFADKVTITDNVDENNLAVKVLSGYAKDSKTIGHIGQKGNVLFSDVFIPKDMNVPEKILNHVSIDRFTGGAISGALFDEKVIVQKSELHLNIIVAEARIKELCKEFGATEPDQIIKAFELSLKDIATGMLPLGGGTMRGHGCFSGTLKKNDIDLKVDLIAKGVN